MHRYQVTKNTKICNDRRLGFQERRPRLPGSCAALVFVMFSAVFLQLSGCSLPDSGSFTVQSEAWLLEKGREALREEHYRVAVEQYEKLRTAYPFGKNVRDASLELAYAYYKNLEPHKATALLENYVLSYPNNQNLDYVYYLKGLADFHHAEGFMNKILHRDRGRRDPQPMVDSFTSFQRVVKDYPLSSYVKNSREHTVVLRNLLAIHEIRIADYYFRRGAYVATVSRIEYMLEHYDGAQHTPQALVLLATAYQRLQENKLAQDALRVLKLNYPGYYQKKLFKTPVEEEDVARIYRDLRTLTKAL